MIYIDWRKGKVSNTLEVDVLCSKCKQVHTTVIDRISKLSMSICPYCNNVDVERTAGKIPATVEKQLHELVSKNLIYTIDGMDAEDFLTGLSLSDLDVEGYEEFRALNNAKSYSGLYRLKSYYGQAKTKQQVNLDDFPSFETFMLWSVKHGYRDWKTLKLDEQNKVSMQARWVAGGYNKKGADKTLQLTTDLMTGVAELKNTITNLTAEITEQTRPNLDMNILGRVMTNLLNQLNNAEAEVMKKL